MTSTRRELKFVVAAGDAHHFDGWLRSVGFGPAYAPRVIHNVYFDDFAFGTLGEKLDGIAARSKVRFRWYGPSDRPTAGTLEIKRRRNHAGWKDSVDVDASTFAHDDWRAFRRELVRAAGPLGRRWLDEHPLAVLVNEYRREYLVTAGGRVRATIDRDITAFAQRSSRPNWTRRIPGPDRVVLEIKHAEADRDHVASLLAGIPARVTAHSKYALAVLSAFAIQ